MIDAEVIELRSRVPIDSALTARDLLHKLEQRHLLERLPFDRVLPEVKVEFSDVTDYRRFATLIEAPDAGPEPLSAMDPEDVTPVPCRYP